MIGESYLTSTKIWVSTSENKADPNQRSNTTYTLVMPREVEDVVGLHISGYYFPRWSLGPSFWPPNPEKNIPGNDRADVQIQPPLASGYSDLSFVLEFPSVAMVYSDDDDPVHSYTHTVARMLNAAVVGTEYEDALRFRFLANSLLGTRIEADPLVPALQGTTITFLFDTGPNRERAAWRTMGFTGARRDVFLVAGEFALESDSYADVRRIRYLDISYEGGDAMENPIRRIYTPSFSSKDDFANSFDAYSESLSQSLRQLVFLKGGEPIRRLKQLDLTLRYADGVDPEDLLGPGGVFADHEFELTVLHIVRTPFDRGEYAPAVVAL